jgi:LPS-assembly protein
MFTCSRCLVIWLVFFWAGLHVHGQYIRPDLAPDEPDEPLSLQSPVPRGGADAPPRAAQPRAVAAPLVPTPAAASATERVEIDADRMEYDADLGVMRGIGNVKVQQGQDVLRADYIEVHAESQEAMARGNVSFVSGARVWAGEELSYNFKTRIGDFGEFSLFNDPFYIHARDSEQLGPQDFRLEGARLTTCSEEDRQEFGLYASSASITDGSILRARNVVVKLYGVPIFYLPYLKRDFSKRTNFDVMPGYSSKMGAFLLTAYNYYPVPHIKGSTQLDYRSERGFGVGQRFRWRLPESQAQGRFQAYFTQDDRPIRSDSERLIREGLVEEDRYWIGFRHAQPLGGQNALISDLNYVSDPFVLEDFFDDDFQQNVQPENRVTLIHRDNRYTAGLQLNMRLNDFFGNVNRLPEGSLDINRLEIADTGIYYESDHRAGFLQRVFPEQTGDEDYDALRVDTAHTLFYPMRHFGFLSVVPSVGYRGTWYSDTPDQTLLLTNMVAVLDAQGLPIFDENGGMVLTQEVASAVIAPGSAEFRSLFELGLETSYKAFRVLNNDVNHLGQGLRHVAEPYAAYTFVPEPNMRPNELHQFDFIDQLDKRHDIRVGMRNKLQTRRRNGVHDFLDLNTYTIYRVDPEIGEEDFDDFFYDARVRMTDWVHVDFDGAFDLYESDMRLLNTRVRLYGEDRSAASLEYRFNRDGRQTVQGSVVLFPDDIWSYRGYWRFDIEEGELEEHSYLVQRRLDCTMIGVGVRGRLDSDDETEWRVWAQVSLLAFPESELRLGR